MSMRQKIILLLRSGSLAGVLVALAGVGVAQYATLLGPVWGARLAAAGAILAALSRPLQEIVLILMGGAEHDDGDLGAGA